MSDFAKSWRLSRQRFIDSVTDLNHSQLNYRIHPGVLTIGEMALHVVGVEIWFISQLVEKDLNQAEIRLTQAATEGVVNDHQFPYESEEVGPALVAWAFKRGEMHLAQDIDDPSEELLAKEIKSALGPVITGEGALTRLAFHPAYHQGQVHLIRTAPEFPA